jgi:Protein of unknown function (DUF3209)
MACHEIAGLRLGLMHILGINDEAEKQHELAELGDGAREAGPIRSLTEAQSLEDLKRFFDASLSLLDQRVSTTSADDSKLPYLRTLLVLTRKVEQDLGNQIEMLTRFYRDLDEMHDFVHEIYPAQ